MVQASQPCLIELVHSCPAAAAMVQASQTYYNAENLVVRLLDGALFLAVQLWTPAMNNFGIVHCFGSGYTMRRKALDQVGGWSTYS